MTRGGGRERRETETPPRRAPALGSRFRENDGGASAGWQALLVAKGFPLSRDGRFAKRPYDGVWGSQGCDGGLEWGCPAPLDSCLRRNDEWGWAGTTVVCGGTLPHPPPSRGQALAFPPRGKGYPAALPLWIPAFAGMDE